jgi:hypothetical protein
MKTNVIQRLLIVLISTLLLGSKLYAADINNTFNLYMLNSTSETFVIQSISVQAGTTLKVDKEVWKPGTTMQLTAENNASNGVGGRIVFLDSQGRETRFRYEVREQRHTGQALLTFANEYYYADLLEKERNKTTNGRYLTYLSAKTEWKAYVRIR